MESGGGGGGGGGGGVYRLQRRDVASCKNSGISRSGVINIGSMQLKWRHLLLCKNFPHTMNSISQAIKIHFILIIST